MCGHYKKTPPNSDGHQCRRTFVTDYRPISDENQKFEVVGIPSAISDGIPTKHGSSEYTDELPTTFRLTVQSSVEVALGDRKKNVKLEGVEAKADDVSKGAVKLSDDKQDTAVGNDYNKDLKIVSLVPKCIREVEDEDEDDEDDEC
ncbi:hypothetical protein F2Q69_00009121 [Brassica cretica]|uniref:Uncharacterized protein n=1 Tax=Brassica cretica TaxID=69181 RepID=A0A8S9NP25_BRACR|nr:hypothetical protein F2Q69_00009121 [Brassica cretica]